MVINRINELGKEKKLFWVLIDPDKQTVSEAADFAKMCEKNGVDLLLVGTSLTITDRFFDTVKKIKEVVSLPVVVFPASATHISKDADAMLFISLVSGRNPQYLIGEHVNAAPLIKSLGIETIPVAYMLIEAGSVTAVNFMSNTLPIPRKKSEIAVAHALAAQYLGMKFVYLEGGSGAEWSVPDEMIFAVKKAVDIPVIVGGGIATPEDAAKKIRAGADIVVVGTALEKNREEKLLRRFRDAIK